MQGVGAELVEKPDSAPLLAHIQQDSAPLLFDLRQRGRQLLAAVTAQRAKRVARQAFGVHAAEHVFPVADVAFDQRNVMFAVEQVAVAVGLEIAVLRGQARQGDALH